MGCLLRSVDGEYVGWQSGQEQAERYERCQHVQNCLPHTRLLPVTHPNWYTEGAGTPSSIPIIILVNRNKNLL